MYEDYKFTRLTLEQRDKKLVWEMPYEDIGADDLIHALNTLLIGFTFHQNTIYNAMAEYLQEHASNLYDIYDHVESELVGDTLDDEGD
jgi:phosphotransferase system IIB component